MRDHSLDPDTLDAAAARERAALAASIKTFQDRLSASMLIASSVRVLADQAKPLTSTIARRVDANPLAAATTAVGVAWLIFGRRDRNAGASDAPLGGTTFDALSRWEDEGGPGLPDEDPVDRLEDGGRDGAAKARLASAGQAVVGVARKAVAAAKPQDWRVPTAALLSMALGAVLAQILMPRRTR